MRYIQSGKKNTVLELYLRKRGLRKRGKVMIQQQSVHEKRGEKRYRECKRYLVRKVARIMKESATAS